jgi:5,10-methenyltetrahydromethanopterin hydrogenase
MPTLTPAELAYEAHTILAAVDEYIRARYGRRFAMLVWITETDADSAAYAHNVAPDTMAPALRELANEIEKDGPKSMVPMGRPEVKA